MKKAFFAVLAVCMLLTVLPFAALATEEAETEPPAVREANQCGDNLTWHYDGGTLTISGTGVMDDYAEGEEPWRAHKESITKVVLSGNITDVGACAFTDYDALSEVEFGEALVNIGYRAFKSCDSLKRIVLPETFRKFDEECFMGCTRLGEIWCRGGMPSFKASCIWDVSATIFYPPSKAWPSEYVIPLGDAFRWKIQFQVMDVPQEYLPASAQTVAEEPAQMEVVATEAVATEPVETVPETTVPETTVATEPEETIPAETETEPTLPEWLMETEATEPAQVQKEDSSSRGMLVFGVIAVVVVLFILVGALVFRRRSY